MLSSVPHQPHPTPARQAGPRRSHSTDKDRVSAGLAVETPPRGAAEPREKSGLAIPRHALNHSTWVPENLGVPLLPLPAREGPAHLSRQQGGRPPTRTARNSWTDQGAQVRHWLAGG